MSTHADAYLVRSARPEDLARLAEIERAAGRRFADTAFPEVTEHDPTDLEDLEEAWGEGLVWVACAGDDRPVGFALVERVGKAAHLEELSVHPDHGRRGLGSRLVEVVCAWARREGLPAVTLTTFRNVPFNAPLYARLGFEILDPEELSPELRELFAEEAASGLGTEHRVCMLRSL